MVMGFIKRHGVLAIALGASVLQTLYFVDAYGLLAPASRLYNDSDYQYVLSATYVLSGPHLPLFVHPGLSETFGLGLFFALLGKLSLLSTWTLTGFLHSPEPFDRMISLLSAGRAWSALVAVAYLALVYVSAMKLTGNRWLSALAVWANVFYVGVLEQAFVVRPEPLSVLFCLCLLPAYLSLGRSRDFRLAIPFFALSGILLALALSAKILALLYLPFWLLMARDTVRRTGDLAGRAYWLSLGLLGVVTALLLITWKDIFALQNVLAPFASRHHARIALLRTWALDLAGAAGLLFAAVAVVAGRYSGPSHSNRAWAARFRKCVLLCLATLAGAFVSLFVYAVNFAPQPAAWAKTLVSTAVVETIGFSALNATPPTRLLDLVVSQELRFILLTMWGPLILFVLGLYYSKPGNRLHLALLLAVVWAFEGVFALRGAEGVQWSYQIYVLPVVTGIGLLSAESILRAQKSRLISVSVALALAGGVAADGVHISRYRDRLFSGSRTPLAVLTNIDFSERGNFTKAVLYQRFCEADHLPASQCLSRLAVLFEDAQARH